VADAAAGRLELQTVRVVAQGSDRVRVSGVAEGALVVSAGAHKLDSGMRVRPVRRPLDSPLDASQADTRSPSGGVASATKEPSSKP
jgi:hypothetical protein